jgi:DNA-binding transcriptional MocR family regulator
MIAKRPLQAVLRPEALFAPQARSVIEQRLRDAILDGSLVEGTPVRQQEVADLYSVSRMPAREAIRQLEAQGLLTGSPFCGVVVAPRPIESTSSENLSKAELLALLEQYPDDATFHFYISGSKNHVTCEGTPATASTKPIQATHHTDRRNHDRPK